MHVLYLTNHAITVTCDALFTLASFPFAYDAYSYVTYDGVESLPTTYLPPTYVLQSAGMGNQDETAIGSPALPKDKKKKERKKDIRKERRKKKQSRESGVGSWSTESVGRSVGIEQHLVMYSMYVENRHMIRRGIDYGQGRAGQSRAGPCIHKSTRRPKKKAVRK
ncbi:hypothetical protein K504DRAFT_187295 [Pleomassaria siparia CBS 279.74]|uniref:Uncharacterized protein n=1 Tax=Pleomassaria siparia CBS 279.74 TaxID=1314801 RepID=A0A6G1JR74_9PLEO|nr:hypothetical protein K504DRAFT_187295 [Pleomassaria siparia CBS 279.74]